MLEQALDLGEPGARSHPFMVMGPSHLPLLVYVPQDDPPTSEQVRGFLTYSGFFDPGTTFALTDATSGTVPIVISIPPRAHLMTVLFPAPDETPTMLQLSVTSECRLDLLQLPIRRGMELVFPRLTHAAVIRERFGAGTSSSSRAGGDMSLIQLRATLRRQEQPPQSDSPDTPPIDGAQETSNDEKFVPPTKWSIPTPFGRRRLPASATGDNTPVQGPVSAQQRGAAKADNSDATLISLCHCIPLPDREEHQSQTQLRFGVHRDMFEDVFKPFGTAAFCTDWRCVPGLHHNTRQFLENIQPLPDNCQPDALQIYVDGSFFPASEQQVASGWALCLLGRFQHTWYWVGHLSKATGSGNEGTLDEAVSSAFTTELAGLIHALAVCVAIPVEASIGYDCQAAGDVILGKASLQASSRLEEAAILLRHLLTIQNRAPHMHHLRSHKGHPLNEFCDAAAKASAKNSLPSSAPNSIHQAMQEGVLEWLWLALGTCKDIPALTESGTLLDDPTSQTHQTKLSQVLPRPSFTEPDSTRLGFRAVTYNCLSCAATFQRESLDSQFHKKRCSLIGIQESRTPGPPRSQTAHYHVLCSASSEGQLGCQLWFSKSDPLGWVKDVPILWDPRGFSIIHSQPRILSVLAKAGDLKFVVTVAHAYTSKESQTVRQAWWQQLSAVLKMAPPAYTPLLFIDANAQMHLQGTKSESDNCHMFAKLLQEHQLQHSGNTTSDGETFTSWVGPDGRRAAIDYICTPTAMAEGMRVEGPLVSFKGLLLHDHAPIAVSFDWQRLAKASFQN